MITIPVPEGKREIEGFEAFAKALETTYNLGDLNAPGLKWVDLKPQSHSATPDIRVKIAEDHPHLSIVLRPSNSKGEMTCESEQFYSPLLVTDVNRWGQSDLALKAYQIDRWKGRPGPETMFQKSRSLAEIVEMDHATSIKDSTPVVEAVCLLPMAPNREFETQFVPTINFDLSRHVHYRISVITENALSTFGFLSQGNYSVSVKDIDEAQKLYNWKADSLANLSEMETLMLPSSKGHMILITTPVEAPRPKFDFFRDSDSFRESNSRLSFDSRLTMGASIGGVSIGRGSQSGKGNLYEGEVTESQSGNSAIYHIEFLGVTPDRERSFYEAVLGNLRPSLGNYQTN